MNLKEIAQQEARIAKMQAEGRDEYDINKQNEVLEECRMMVPHTQANLCTAYKELCDLVVCRAFWDRKRLLFKHSRKRNWSSKPFCLSRNEQESRLTKKIQHNVASPGVEDVSLIGCHSSYLFVCHCFTANRKRRRRQPLRRSIEKQKRCWRKYLWTFQRCRNVVTRAHCSSCNVFLLLVFEQNKALQFY